MKTVSRITNKIKKCKDKTLKMVITYQYQLLTEYGKIEAERINRDYTILLCNNIILEQKKDKTRMNTIEMRHPRRIAGKNNNMEHITRQTEL